MLRSPGLRSDLGFGRQLGPSLHALAHVLGACDVGWAAVSAEPVTGVPRQGRRGGPGLCFARLRGSQVCRPLSGGPRTEARGARRAPRWELGGEGRGGAGPRGGATLALGRQPRCSCVGSLCPSARARGLSARDLCPSHRGRRGSGTRQHGPERRSLSAGPHVNVAERSKEPGQSGLPDMSRDVHRAHTLARRPTGSRRPGAPGNAGRRGGNAPST